MQRASARQKASARQRASLGRLAALMGLAVSATLCVGCGGRSEQGSEPDASTRTAGSTGDEETGSTGDDATESTSGGTGFDDNLSLGECPEGWPVYEGDCPWLGSNHLCYATKADACACLCPRDRRSTCVSGLPGGSDAQTAVSCF